LSTDATVRNSALAGLIIVAILDVVALVLIWEGGDSFPPDAGFMIGLSILFLTGLPWSLLTELMRGYLVDQDFFLLLLLAILVVCSLLNGGIVGSLIGKRREPPPPSD
jgi:hypothetical protein